MNILEALILAGWLVLVGSGVSVIVLLAIDALVETVRSRRRDRL